MKRIVIITFLLLSTALIFSQAPQSINYQAVYKDASTSIYAKKTTVAVIVSILKDSPSGQEVFNEVHSTTLNETGLFTLEIGAVNIDDFVAIDWSDGPYFLRVNVNGTDFGTSQILSVPYAIYADSAGNVFSGEYGALANIPSTFTPETHSHTVSDITDLTHYSDLDIDGNEAAFDGWDKDVSDDFDGEYSSLSGAPKNLSEFNNDAGYLTRDSLANISLPQHAIGDTAYGGIIVYLTPNNEHGLVLSLNDIVNRTNFYRADNFISDPDYYEFGRNYTDWRMPRIFELEYIANLPAEVISTFQDSYYWSSSKEPIFGTGWVSFEGYAYNPITGVTNLQGGGMGYPIRSIRSF